MNSKHLTRTATIAGARAADKTWPIVISTTTPVDRSEYTEILSHDPGAVDLSRAPLPVIEVHDRSRVNVGLVEDLHLDGDTLRGTLRLGASARALELAADIDADIVRGVSIGYQILKLEVNQEGPVEVLTATLWMPFEVSLVSVPADINSGINRSIDMNEQQPEGILAERQRSVGIQNVVTTAKLDPELARNWVAEGISVDVARTRAFAELASRDVHHMPAHIDTHDSRHAEFRAAASDALLLRAGVRIANPHPAARDLRNMSVREMMRTMLRRTGVRVDSLTDHELITRNLSTSDFPALLENVAQKALRKGFEAESQSHRKWVNVTEAADFKLMKRPLLGSAPNLDPINEYGEYTHGELLEDAAGFQVAKFGRMILISWEMLINDDLGSLSRIPQAFGIAAVRREADLVYGPLADNSGMGPTMGDSKALFHADHGNLTSSGGGTLEAVLIEGRTLLRRQKALGGGEMNLQARYLIVPPEQESEAEMLLASGSRIITSGVESNVPRWISSLELVVESRLSDGVAYLAADHAAVDTCELAILADHPSVQESQEIKRDAIGYKARHVAGAKYLDYRGMVMLRNIS